MSVSSSKSSSSKKTSQSKKTNNSKKNEKTKTKTQVQKAGGKSKNTVTKTQVTKKTETETKTVVPVVKTDTKPKQTKNQRSFKVQLPGSDVYVGRFTGLTPYQAANKALSKYYRETKKPKHGIQFSIRESTRGSKRSTYSYNGARLKLDEPVKYTISTTTGEDREIVKKFKNILTKIKKNELNNTN